MNGEVMKQTNSPHFFALPPNPIAFVVEVATAPSAGNHTRCGSKMATMEDFRRTS